ncbi:hypothetical protein M426DRAFT_322178 [Hypoxylon sp. CI-4A]|nr:hypothetical protein M426DRAFT_322178 [Hypoxylon sp. CI-4A]
MKYSGASLIAIIASLAGVQAADHPPFLVTKLSAGATPHSSIGYVELTWSYSGGLNQTSCSARPGTYQSFPSIAQTTCSDPSTSFNLTRRAEGGADLELWHEMAPGSLAYAIHSIKAEEIIWTNQQSPTGTVQTYAGPQNFTVAATYPDA